MYLISSENWFPFVWKVCSELLLILLGYKRSALLISTARLPEERKKRRKHKDDRFVCATFTAESHNVDHKSKMKWLTLTL